MADPLTSTRGLAVPTRGSDSGTWDVPVNNDMIAIDGMFGGVQSISLTNANVTLTVPATFSQTPGAGPTQSQNGVIKLIGTLSGNCAVLFPMPGFYIIDNRCTVGSFWVAGVAGVGGGKAIGFPPGQAVHVYSDGIDMWYVNLPPIGSMLDLAGVSAVPLWITICAIPPYLLCDGSAFSGTTYPALSALFAASFGNNTPDLRGRWRIPYDGSGTRITSAGSGINGQSLGASGGAQNETLSTGQIPQMALSTTAVTLSQTNIPFNQTFAGALGSGTGGTGNFVLTNNAGIGTITGSISATVGAASPTAVTTVPPALVFGITLVRAG